MKKFYVPFTLACLVTFGCSSSGTDPEPTPTPTPTVSPTLSNIQTLVFSPSCTAAACHDASLGGDLDLTSGMSYAELVDVPAFQTNAAGRGKVLVIPGDPDNSFLVQKLDGTLELDEGEVMPRQTSGLSSSRIELIRQWILAGALDN